jgi:hypothetical protein
MSLSTTELAKAINRLEEVQYYNASKDSWDNLYDLQLRIKPKIKYKIGYRFKDIYDHECMIVQVEPLMCCVIDLTVGNRYDQPIKVGDVNAITEAEFSRMINTYHLAF